MQLPSKHQHAPDLNIAPRRLWEQLERAQKRVLAAEAGRDAATADLAAAAHSSRQREHALEAAASKVAASLRAAETRVEDLEVGPSGE